MTREEQKRKAAEYRKTEAYRTAHLRAALNYQKRHPEKEKDRHHRYYATHREENLRKAAEWRRRNPEKVAKYNAYWRTQRAKPAVQVE